MGWLRMAHTLPASSVVWTQRRRQRSRRDTGRTEAGPHTRTHTMHTRAHTHARAHTCTRTHACMHTQRTHVCIHNAHTHRGRPTHARTHTPTHTCVHTQHTRAHAHTCTHMHTHVHIHAHAHTHTHLDKGEGARGWPSQNKERGGDGGGLCDLGQGPLVSEPCSWHRKQRRWGTLVNPEPCWSDGLPYRITDWGSIKSRVHLQVLWVVMTKKVTTSVVWGPHQPILS